MQLWEPWEQAATSPAKHPPTQWPSRLCAELAKILVSEAVKVGFDMNVKVERMAELEHNLQRNRRKHQPRGAAVPAVVPEFRKPFWMPASELNRSLVFEVADGVKLVRIPSRSGFFDEIEECKELSVTKLERAAAGMNRHTCLVRCIHPSGAAIIGLATKVKPIGDDELDKHLWRRFAIRQGDEIRVIDGLNCIACFACVLFEQICSGELRQLVFSDGSVALEAVHPDWFGHVPAVGRTFDLSHAYTSNSPFILLSSGSLQEPFGAGRSIVFRTCFLLQLGQVPLETFGQDSARVPNDFIVILPAPSAKASCVANKPGKIQDVVHILESAVAQGELSHDTAEVLRVKSIVGIADLRSCRASSPAGAKCYVLEPLTP
eukprot:4815836-Amphidinium_carterae.3